MSQYYNNLKLRKIMAIYGCELKPSIRVGYLDVVAEDGNIVLHGTIDQIREDMGMTMIAYGEPIVHPSAVSFYKSTPIIKASRQAKVGTITAEMDEEMARMNAQQAQEDLASCVEKIDIKEADSGCEAGTEDDDPPVLEEVRSTSPNTVGDIPGAGFEEPVIRGHVVSPPPGFCLPDNRIGALEESCRPLGISPTYTVTRRKDPAAYYDCQVNLGYFETRARGSSKQKARHNAAGLMLYKISDADPFVKPSDEYHAELESGDLITYNERYVPLGLEDCHKAAHSLEAPRKATWAGVAYGVASSVMPRLNRRQRRAREFAAKAIPQSRIDDWAEEPISDAVWDKVGDQKNHCGI